jgi:hypothetical protein
MCSNTPLHTRSDHCTSEHIGQLLGALRIVQSIGSLTRTPRMLA